MQHDQVLKKLNFGFLTPRLSVCVCGGGGGGLGQSICYHVATFRDSNIFEKQHDHVLKKLNFDLFTPSLG